MKKEEMKWIIAEDVVKIQDLQQQLARFNKFMEINEWSSIQEMQDTLNGCEQKYLEQQHQLAEKEKEIDELRKKCEELSNKEFEHFGDMKTYKNMWLQEQRKNKKLRHQVCEEIRKTFGNKAYELFGDNHRLVSIHADDFNNKLDLIEQGDE